MILRLCLARRILCPFTLMQLPSLKAVTVPEMSVPAMLRHLVMLTECMTFRCLDRMQTDLRQLLLDLCRVTGCSL